MDANMADLFDVTKEVVLVTGASQGLGRHFARLLASHGAAVVLAARQTDKLESLALDINGKGGRAAAVRMDVTDGKSVADAFDAFRRLFEIWLTDQKPDCRALTCLG